MNEYCLFKKGRLLPIMNESGIYQRSLNKPSPWDNGPITLHIIMETLIVIEEQGYFHEDEDIIPIFTHTESPMLLLEIDF